uniref:Putative trypsin-like peptidase domain containing protein n=1 Tax=viral metagenome TaxID=1070528 RepID=A0A6M3IPQ8_9ZZZZ
MLNQVELHEKILYPVVRVRTGKAGGSGTVIYSRASTKDPSTYQSFVLTCAHVITNAIKIKMEWDGLLKKEIRKEFMEQVQVEVFDYVYLSQVNSSNSYRADIIAYDKTVDLAVLKVDTPKPLPFTATLIPKEKLDSLKVFDASYTSGCSLGHDPIVNQGQITYLTERIDNKVYLMSNSASIFGNSGGALFSADTGEQIGVTARITSLQLGFGVDIITWMGFCVSPQEIYKFLDEQEIQFLYNPADTFEECMLRRERKQKSALKQPTTMVDEELNDEEPFAEAL